jgi:protein-tyrosine phosphatase
MPEPVAITVSNLGAARARSALAEAYHAVRSFPDRVLHRRRHAEARHRVSNMRRPKSILVVCHGNICRSPYLHAVLQRVLPDIAVSSAGFVGADRGAPVLSLDVSARRGIDLSRFRSQRLTPELVGGADVIIVMEPDQARYIERVYRVRRERLLIAGDLDPAVAPTRAIRDPWMKSVDVFESSFSRLDRCAATLAAALNQSRGR